MSASSSELSALVKELNFSSNLAACEVTKLNRLYKEVGEMGYFRQVWDSKVPEDEKSLFNFVSFERSNPAEIKKEIQSYCDFYEQIKGAGDLVKSSNGSNTAEEACDLALELISQLQGMLTNATSGVMSTSSSTLYKLHQEFVGNHTKLECMIRRVENKALIVKQRQLTKRWEDSLGTISDLTNKWGESLNTIKELTTMVQQLLLANSNNGGSTGSQQ